MVTVHETSRNLEEASSQHNPNQGTLVAATNLADCVRTGEVVETSNDAANEDAMIESMPADFCKLMICNKGSLQIFC